METRNLSKGLHQVFLSKLINVIAAILTIIGLFVMIGGMAMGQAAVLEADSLEVAGAVMGMAGTGVVVGSILSIVGAVLLIIALILMLVGLGNAGKDDARFKTVLLFALISLACSIISSFVGTIPYLPQILKIVATVLDLLVVIFTIQYASDDLEKIGRSELAEFGKKILMVVLIIVIVDLIVSILPMFMVALATVLSIIALVLQIVYWFAFMIFLAKASRAFAS